MSKASEDLEKATQNVKNAVVNIKEASEIAKTIDTKAAGLALGLAIFGTFMAPKYVPLEEKKVIEIEK